VAVTKEQINEYNLPLMPLEEIGENIDEDYSDTDADTDTERPRHKKRKGNALTNEFERLNRDENGVVKATHLNAFFTRAHFDAFEKIVLDVVDSHWYEEIYDVMKEIYNDIEPENEPKSLTEEELKEKRLEMYRRISRAFAQGWYQGMKDAPYYW
jgi:hypothetical protein